MSIFPEMNDDKAAFFALSLVKNICISFEAAKFESDDQTSGLYRLLDKLSSESKNFHKDPVIRSFFLKSNVLMRRILG